MAGLEIGLWFLAAPIMVMLGVFLVMLPFLPFTMGWEFVRKRFVYEDDGKTLTPWADLIRLVFSILFLGAILLIVLATVAVLLVAGAVYVFRFFFPA